MKLLSKNKFKFTIKDSYLENLLPRFREERIRAFLTLASTLLAVSIFGFFAINPTLTTIAQLKKQLADSKFVDLKLVEKIASLSTLQQSYVQLQNSIPVIMNSVPPTPNMPLFVAQIQAISQTMNVKIIKIQTLPVEITSDSPKNGYFSFGFTIDATGTITAINNFITAIQSFDRLVTAEGFSIVRSSTDPNNLQLSFKGKAYFKKS